MTLHTWHHWDAISQNGVAENYAYIGYQFLVPSPSAARSGVLWALLLQYRPPG